MYLVCNKRKYGSVTECMYNLHWLPVKLRIRYKVLTIVQKCIHGDAPTYLKELIKLKIASRSFRSSQDETLLQVPYTKNETFADRALSVCGPIQWNLLPRSMREISSYDSFIKKLKTMLLKEHYDTHLNSSLRTRMFTHTNCYLSLILFLIMFLNVKCVICEALLKISLILKALC